MKNKKLGNMLKELNVETTEKIEVEREKFTTTLDKDMLDDYRDLCKALKIQFNVGIETMFHLLSNNKDYLKDFLDETKRL